MTRLAKPIFDNDYPKKFFFVNLYQTAKCQAISLICSRVDFKILQFDWLKAFWLIYQEQDFSQKTASNINFHYRTNSVKTDDHIFQ